jgi:predicted RNA-binding protein with RPS1 domain
MSEILENVVSGAPPEEEMSPEMALAAAANELAQAADTGEVLLVASEDGAGDIQDLATTRNKFTNIRSEQRVVSIDSKPSVKTEADKQMSNLVNLVASLRSRHILCGKLEGVENSTSGEPRGILQYGEFKVLIPCNELMDVPENMRDMNPNDVMRYMFGKRLGAEIEFIVLGIDQGAEVVIGSRKEAMNLRRRQFYYGHDREGNNFLYEGAIAEARIMSAIRTGIFVELFGVETYIPAIELSYQRILDCTKNFIPGQRVLVKILSLDRSNAKDIRITLSVKQANRNPYEFLTNRYVVGNSYIGTVTIVDVNGVFVALDGGVDCLCPYPPRGVPIVGSRATVRLYKVDNELKRLNGDIVFATYSPD